MSIVLRLTDRRLTAPRDVARALSPLAGFALDACYFGVVWVLRGDLEYFWQEYGQPNPNSRQPCIMCPATTNADDPVQLHEYRGGQMRWLSRIYSKAQFFTTRYSAHALFHKVHGGISSLTFMPDLLHCKHLGTDQYFYGSVLWILIYVILPDGHADNLKTIFDHIKDQYGTLNIEQRFQNMTLNMISNKTDPPTKFPCLKGKGAECRHLGAALQPVFESYMNVDNLQHNQINIALKHSVAIERILSDYKDCFRFPDNVGREFKDHCFAFLLAFNALANFYSKEVRVMLFDVTMKAHYLGHIGLLALHINPRLGWAYSGEDMMRHCKQLMSSCVRGTPLALGSEKFGDKYRIAMGLKLCGDQREPLLK